MIKHKLILFTTTVFVALIFIIPAGAQAYGVTGQSATRLTDKHVLFTISYDFGFLNRELYLPIVATHAPEEITQANNVAFTLIADTNTVLPESITAIILTTDEDVTVTDQQYYLEQGRSAEFTLMAIATLPATSATETPVALHITHLPITMISPDGTVTTSFLDPVKLTEYRTRTLGESGN